MKQIGMKQIFNSISIVVVALLSLCQANLAFAQLNTFEAGQPIRASEMNHNFEVVQEQIEEISTSSIADAGCSATQQDNSVLIECSDGTSGVIAGAGTVVVYPEGTIGDTPDITSIPQSAFVIFDSNDSLVGEYHAGAVSANDWVIKLTVSNMETYASIWNDASSNSTKLTTRRDLAPYYTAVFYTSTDCSGPGFTRNINLLDMDDQYLVALRGERVNTIFYSQRSAARLDLNQLIPATECEETALIEEMWLTVSYTPPPEILNAAYPVRLEQLP